jgi:hypothetical protein
MTSGVKNAVVLLIAKQLSSCTAMQGEICAVILQPVFHQYELSAQVENKF